MLESISWQEFFTTVAVLLSGYYAITTLLLYSKEITSIFKQRQPNHSVQKNRVNQIDSNESNSLMGMARYEQGSESIVPREEVTNVDELNVAPLLQDEEPVTVIDLREELLLDDFIAIQAEIKSLSEIITLGTKEEGVSLFKTLISNYPQFIGTHFQPQIVQFIYESCENTNTHHFDQQEINSWWTAINDHQ
ncbi:MAG: hypothetical protein KF803_02645 [Cyclobacteriaceae bacterium]|nr:hypothetical protein [Cyclobacteriaceae bacterium]